MWIFVRKIKRPFGTEIKYPRPKLIAYGFMVEYIYTSLNHKHYLILKTKMLKNLLFLLVCCFLISCSETKKKVIVSQVTESKKTNSGDFDSQEKWGEHLVTIMDCSACHTPKKMTDKGPVPDNSLFLSGHPADMPRIEIDRKEIENKGLSVAMDLTEWIGPWGVSFTANLTPDDTGLGNWSEDQFMLAIREGKSKGLSGSRTLLPPMPWEMYRHMTDDELKAVFAYLKSIKPISNVVPPPLPPVGH